MIRRILVASDGTPAADGALRLARAFARDGAAVRLLGVLEPTPLVAIGAAYPVPVFDGEIEGYRGERLRAALEAQTGPGWLTSVEVGHPPAVIVRVAEEEGAEAILLGIGAHGVSDRWLGSETALHVSRLARVPVLAAHPLVEGPPARIVAAVDFSRQSLDAARLAASLAGPGAEIHLVNVLFPRTVQSEEWGRTYRSGALARLKALAGGLCRTGGPTLHLHLPQGDPAGEVLALATRVKAELVACGSHGYGAFGRLVMGSVSTRILRGSRCSVLVAPGTGVPAEAETGATEAAVGAG